MAKQQPELAVVKVTKCNASQPGIFKPCAVCGRQTEDRAFRVSAEGIPEAWLAACAAHGADQIAAALGARP